MKQRSTEWFKARTGRITASSVGAILGLSPYMTREDVMRNMVREWLGAEREFKGNVATEYGTNNEPGALIDYRLEIGYAVKEVGFIAFEDWAGASPDGLIGEKGGVEIKCPYGLRKDEQPEFKTCAQQPHYYAQVQFTMFVTGREWWDFWQWAPNGQVNETVVRDQSWIDENVPKLRQFYAEFLHEVQNNPDEHLQPKRQVIDTPEAHKMIEEWDDIAEQMALLAERKKDLLEAITGLSDGRDMIVAGRKVTQVERAGAVSYARVVKDQCPDVELESYRGKPSKIWRVT